MLLIIGQRILPENHFTCYFSYILACGLPDSKCASCDVALGKLFESKFSRLHFEGASKSSGGLCEGRKIGTSLNTFRFHN